MTEVEWTEREKRHTMEATATSKEVYACNQGNGEIQYQSYRVSGLDYHMNDGTSLENRKLKQRKLFGKKDDGFNFGPSKCR